jgi:putative ABC transport system permease protein
VTRAFAEFTTRLAGDLRDAARQLRHEPLYAAVMIGTLSIGIAAAGAIFAVVRGVILRPLPYQNSDAIVTVQEFQPAKRRDQTTVASANVPRLASARALVATSAFNYSEYVVSDERDAERLIGAGVDGDLLTVLGLHPALGRAITTAEGGPNPARVVMVSDAVWRKRLGADQHVIGRSVMVDGAPYTIVGVMPPGFEFPRNPSMSRDVDLWMPRRSASPMVMRRGMRDLTVIARLRAGVSLDDAQLELSTIATRAAQDDAALNEGWQLRVIGLRDMMVGGVRPVLLMLSTCVGVLLLIACANASAGSLARLTMRRQNLGVRLALGATHGRLMELLVSESVLLAAAAATIALPLSAAIRHMLVAIAPVAIPRQAGISTDAWTILFGAAIAVLAALLASICPTMWLRRLDLATFMSDAGRTATGSRARGRVLAVFIVAQLGLATVLLAATARLYTNYDRINRIDPGFAAEHVTSATLAMGGMRYRDPKARSALTGQLLGRVRALPGVERAAVTSLLPLSGGLMSSGYAVVGVAADSSSSAALRAVSSDFFETVGISIKQGRPIERTDDEGALAVVVVNEAFARQSLGGRGALGQSILVAPPGSDSPRSFQIVGIAGDAKERDLISPSTPIIYFSDKQASFPHSVLVVRTHGPAPVAAIRAVLRELDPFLAFDDVGSLAARVRSSYALQQFLLTILAVFATSAAVLIAVGVYGAVSFAAAADRRSIGVRMALGATPSQIVAALIRRTGLLAVVGCSAGVAVAFVLPRLVATDAMLASGVDLESSIAGAAAVVLVAIVATAIPAFRAGATDPLTVLRDS